MIAPSPVDLAPLVNPWKECLERLLAAMMLLPAAPAIGLAALAVKLTSAGPGIYRQTRMGRGGRPFTLYKIRTMAADSEKNGPQWSAPGDPRVTRLGQFLRRTHLDELPQLWNVLVGDMSLIGPRPERPEFLPGLEAAVPRYRDRLTVLPGVTGLAQVQLPADTDLESVRRKLAYDLWYIAHPGAWLDFRLIMATGLKVVGISFPQLRRLLGLPERAAVEEFYQVLVDGACGERYVAAELEASALGELSVVPQSSNSRGGMLEGTPTFVGRSEPLRNDLVYAPCDPERAAVNVEPTGESPSASFA